MTDGDAISDKTDKAPMVNAPKDQLLYQSPNLLGKRKGGKTPTMSEARVALDLTYNDYNLYQMGKVMLENFRPDYLPVGPPSNWPGSAGGDTARYLLHQREFIALMMLGLMPATSSSPIGNADGARGLFDLLIPFGRGGFRGSVDNKSKFNKGTYEVIESSSLQRAVARHRNTVGYVNDTASAIETMIQAKNGQLFDFQVGGKQNDSLISRWTRGEVDNYGNPLENGGKLWRKAKHKLPQYGDYGPLKGAIFEQKQGREEAMRRLGHLSEDGSLGLAIHAYHGARIELKNYQVQDGKFSGTLEYTFYDHFGLDPDDFVLPVGFPAWFALQHDRKYTVLGGKPPIAVVKIRKEISGTV